MYVRIGETQVKRDTFGFGDSMSVEFDEDTRTLRAVLYDNGEYQDEKSFQLVGTCGELFGYDDELQLRLLNSAAKEDLLMQKIKEMEAVLCGK